MIKRIVGSILLIFVGMVSQAQLPLHHPEAYFAPPPGPKKNLYDLQDQEKPEQPRSRIQYNLDIGTMLSSFGGSGPMIRSYLSPSLRYTITPKLDVQVGGSIIYSIPTGNSGMNDGYGMMRNDPSYQFYVHGTYQVSDRLVVDGSFVKTKMNNAIYGYDPYQMNSDFESYSLGFNYRIAKSIRIGAQINVSNGMNPYYYSDPFYNRRSYPYDSFYRQW